MYTCSILHIFLVILSVANFIPQIQSQIGGDCVFHFARLTPRHFLDLPKFMGSWFLHEFASSDRAFDNITPKFKCSRIEYIGTPSELKNGNFKAIETFTNSANGKTEAYKIPITIPKNRNVVNAIWDSVTANGSTKMVILGADLDHTKWNITYSCTVGGPTKNRRWETVAIWTRTPKILEEQREMLKAFLVGLGFPIESHKFHLQNDGC